MNFLRRVIRYSWRQKLRSMILLLIFILLESTALIALSAGQATAEGTKEVKKTVGGSIHMEIDGSNQDNYGAGVQDENGLTYEYNGDYITQEVIDAVKKVNHVVDYSAEDEGGYWGSAVNFKYFPGAFNIDYTGYGQPVPYTVTSNSELNVKFLDGTYTLEEGRHISPDDSYAAMISRELAEKNGLSVGDKITLYSLDSDQKDTFQIVGIFSGTEGMGKEAMMADGIPANQGYIDRNSFQKIFGETTLELSALDVYVDSAENVKEVLNTIQNLPELKGKTFTYKTDTKNFDIISNPLSSLQAMTDTAVIVIAVTGAALITLLLILWTRGRKKEIGILLSVGKNKAEIVMQFLAENILIAIPSAIASFGLTALLIGKVEAFLVSQSEEKITSLTVTVAPAHMVLVFGTGLIIVCLASAAASCTVIRLKPKDILTKMD